MSRAFAPVTTGPLYVGFSVRVENLEGADFLNFQVSDGATGDVTQALGVGIRNNAGNPFFARSGSSGTGQTTNAAQLATDMTDFRVVAKFSQNASQWEIAELFINPPDEFEPVTPDAIANSTAPNMTQLDLFTVRSVGIGGDDAVFIDDLIFADNFADALGIPAVAAAVPEPASIAVWALLGLGCAGFGYVRARLKK
ncbi:MAG: hypothetical protein KDA41_05640 [Planctomycetales bacterium]|nr:hypothetical protein [Planctomycetales bacterium]